MNSNTHISAHIGCILEWRKNDCLGSEYKTTKCVFKNDSLLISVKYKIIIVKESFIIFNLNSDCNVASTIILCT